MCGLRHKFLLHQLAYVIHKYTSKAAVILVKNVVNKHHKNSQYLKRFTISMYIRNIHVVTWHSHTHTNTCTHTQRSVSGVDRVSLSSVTSPGRSTWTLPSFVELHTRTRNTEPSTKQKSWSNRKWLLWCNTTSYTCRPPPHHTGDYRLPRQRWIRPSRSSRRIQNRSSLKRTCKRWEEKLSFIWSISLLYFFCIAAYIYFVLVYYDFYTYGDPLSNCQISFYQYIFSIVIWGPITKFNHHQYFQLYSMCF